MKNFLSKIFKTRKRQPKNGSSAENSQKPRANSQKPSIHAAGINVSTTSDVSQKPASSLSNQQSKFKNQQSSKALDEVVRFLGSYLHCSDHQRNLLALWVLHSHCFSALDYTPYLSVHSTKAQSGKTRCLQLLSLLCPNAALTASVATNNLSSRIHYSEHRPTFLLDQCHATVGSRRRSKNPVLRAILASGFQRGIGHTDRKGERTLFSPKAFAGIGLLPEDLAECSIPIHLERQPVSVKLQHFRSEAVEAEAEPLRQWLAFWGQQNLQRLKSSPALDFEDFPSGIELSPRRKDLFEPLLQIARLLAGDWPRRAAEALTFVFQDQVQRERKHALALLSELREAFSHYGQPERIATASLLVWLHHDPDAPWNQEGPITATRLADILRPFNIRPRQGRKKGEANHRGYTMRDFLYTWDMLLPREPAMNRDTSRREPMPTPPKPTAADEASISAFNNQARVAQAAALPAGAPAVSSAEKPNKNAAGINVSTCSDVGSTAAAGRNLSPVTSNLSPGSSSQEPKANSQEPALHKLDPRIKGILDDPLNYYRHYDDVGKSRMDKIVNEHHHWPQPADDKLPPDVVYSMPDGIGIPFTIVNRHPTDPRPILGKPDFYTQRWPVTLDKKERAQVAIARFYELHAAARAAIEQQQKEFASNREPVSSVVS